MKSLNWRELVADCAERLEDEFDNRFCAIAILRPILTSLVICLAVLGLAHAAKADSANFSNDPSLALSQFIEAIRNDQPKSTNPEIFTSLASSEKSNKEIRLADANSALANFVQLIGSEQPKLIAANVRNSRDDSNSALADFVQVISAEQANPAISVKPKPAIELAATSKAKSSSGASGAASGGADDATFVGSQVCAGCHAGHIEAFGQTLMGKLQKLGKLQCETCHGAGSAHVKAGGGRGVGGIISFRSEDKSRTVEDNNAICLSCHEKGQRTYWSGSTHETRGLACTNCHTVMRNVSRKYQLKTSFQPDTCFQCHKDRRAQMFRSSHMPMRESEGKMVCSDCHNPHGSFTEALLKENSVNDTCYKCHADKRGPLLWEHFPVRENCSNCHSPHGSNNEHLLKMMTPRLCAQCHTAGHGSAPLGNPAAVQSFNRACLNCHTKIHGSNAPGGILFQR